MEYRKDECMCNEMRRLKPEEFGQEVFYYYVGLGYDPTEVSRLIGIFTADDCE